jgi:hypothetical protein
VLRAKARGYRDLATVIGHVANFSACEQIAASNSEVQADLVAT